MKTFKKFLETEVPVNATSPNIQNPEALLMKNKKGNANVARRTIKRFRQKNK